MTVNAECLCKLISNLSSDVFMFAYAFVRNSDLMPVFTLATAHRPFV